MLVANLLTLVDITSSIATTDGSSNGKAIHGEKGVLCFHAALCQTRHRTQDKSAHSTKIVSIESCSHPAKEVESSYEHRARSGLTEHVQRIIAEAWDEQWQHDEEAWRAIQARVKAVQDLVLYGQSFREADRFDLLPNDSKG